MAPPNDNEGAIRVQLSLLSAQDSQAAQQLASSLGQIAKMFEAFKASDFADTARKMADLHKQMKEDTYRMQHDEQTRRMQSGGIPSAWASRATDLRRPDEAIANDLTQAARTQRDKDADEEKQRREKERDRIERDRIENLTNEQHRADQLRRKHNIPGIGAQGDDAREWYNNVESLKGEPTGFRIPRFGELNVQDYINIMRNNRARLALEARKEGTEAGEQGNIGGAIEKLAQSDRLGRHAQHLQKASDVLGYGYAMRNLFGHATNFAASQGFSAGGMDESGAALGFRRTEGTGRYGFLNDAAGFLGIQSPFSEAGGEGWHQSMDITNLRMQSGINAEQASKIVQASASAGFSGDARSDIATEFMAPLFRRFQVDPQALIPFTQTLRTGTATVGELATELANLGDTARAARVDVNTMAQALAQSGEAAQQSGGSYMSGVRFGNQFSTAFGLAPSVGNDLLQNSFVQAQLGAMSGVPTMAQGALPAGMKQEAISRSLQQMVGAYSGAFGDVSQAIRGTDGKVIGHETVSGRDLAIGAAASQLGITPDAAKDMLNRRGASNVGNVMAAARDYEAGVMKRGNKRDANEWLRGEDKDNPAFKYRVVDGQVQSSFTSENKWEKNDRLTKDYQGRAYSDAIDKMTRNVKGGTDERELHRMVRGMGVSEDDWHEAMKSKDPHARRNAVERLVSEKAREANADTKIAFTGPAAKFFKALVNDRGGWDQFGGEPSNAAAASSQGPSPLNSAGNSGLGNLETPMP